MAERGSGKDRFAPRGDGNGCAAWSVNHQDDRLTITFDSGQTDLPPKTVDISAWLVIGAQAPVMAEAFARHYVGTKPSVRSNLARAFRDCFCVYLVERKIKINQPEDAPKGLLKDFYTWNEEYRGVRGPKSQAGEDDEESTKSPLSTRMDRAKPVKAVFAILTSLYADRGWDVEIPRKPFARKKFEKRQVREVDPIHYVRVLEEAAKEATKTLDEVEPKLEEISSAIRAIKANKPYNPASVAHVVAKALVEYDGVLPERKYLQQEDPDLFADIEAHGYTLVRRLAHPQAPDLIPFLYVLAGHTGFNQQPLTYLEVNQIDERTVLGVARMVLSPPKFRANSIVRRSFAATEERLSVMAIVHFITAWTTHLRDAAPEFAKNDLWLFANKWKSGAEGNFPIRSLAARERNAQTELANHIWRFCNSRGLRFTGLREMRLSFSDLYLRLSPGDLDGLRILLGQKRISTTDKHYQTEQSLAAGRELLAGAMAMHERWVGSRGAIDPRSANQRRERTGATAGFNCLDVYDSPILGQVRGRQCTAYGRCPECPLAVLEGDRAYALARLLQLEAAYEEAKNRLGIEVWKQKYLTSYTALKESWLPPLLAQQDVLSAAGLLLLPPLPDLE